MALITTRDLSIGYRGPLLLDQVTCQIEPGQRIGLLGRNGAGKTTFLRLLNGDVQPDHGDVVVAPGTKVSLLPQDIPRDLCGSIHDIVSAVIPHSGIEDEWSREHRVAQILSRMDLDSDASFEELSSGMKRRVLLARTLVVAPDALLLDEPTNHLDLGAITWLEGFLDRWEGTLIFVTHDRMFLRRLADRILEIQGGHVFDWSCGYDTFLKRKEAALVAKEKQDALFDKRLAEEETWIRQGVKARRTRNEGRVLALKKMRQQRADRRSAPANVRLEIQAARRSGDLVVEAKNVTFSYDNRVVVKEFSTTIMRGDKIGVIGPNGAGKTTLLQLLLGRLPPEEGRVRLGTNLDVAYFDQLRHQLDEEKTVHENVGDGYESVGSDGKARHIFGYLQKFLFSPERARTPVRFLSGGERNRVLLAKLFAKPANVIVLDEPTNDLDTETLELLESRLVEFKGTVLLVSHDREFLNNVVTSTLVFNESEVGEYVGGYDDWLRQRPDPAVQRAATESKVRMPSVGTSEIRNAGTTTNRLKFKEKQELAALPKEIERLESEVSRLHEVMAQAGFYQQSDELIATEHSGLKDLEAKLKTAYDRWEELEGLDD